MLNVFKKVFGDKYEKDLKLLRPIVDEINQEYEKIKNLSDEQLKAKTEEFKQKIQERTKETREKIEELNTQLKSDEDIDRQSVHDNVDKLNEQLNEEYEEILDELLPEVYAVIKSTCERLIGKSWTVAGNKQAWEMIPYDVQLIGAVVLHQGKIAEMATGEGKTLVAETHPFAEVYENIWITMKAGVKTGNGRC